MNERYEMTWSEVFERLTRIANGIGDVRVYGVPRGGAVVAGMLGALDKSITPVADPDACNVFVDDIIDSGRTRDEWLKSYPGAPFRALVDKTGADGTLEHRWVVFPWELRDETADLEDTVTRQLEWIGEKPTREGLVGTPRRYLKALQEMTAGLHMDPAEPLKVTFDEAHDEIVCVAGINFVSVCEHHLLAFTGTIDFAYIPAGKIVGLSKIPRMVDALARRPQVQERLVTQIADTFVRALAPRGVMVIASATHSCMSCRGVRSNGSMVTSVVRGIFKEQAESRAECMALLARARRE